ncbi:MAG: TetR family transcriptional regulator [Actinomycetota bacterium]|nr:TetR family transcriptional regulator [Actinomycetota bacterium]
MATITSDLQRSTRDRILDAAFDAVQAFGLSRITVEDVANRARLSRQTVYRYFPSKDHVILFLVAREEEKFIDGVRGAFASHDDPQEAFALAVEFVLRYMHEHPLLDRLLATDAETLLPYLTTRGLPLIIHARETLVELMGARLPDVDQDELRGVLDVVCRAMISYMLTPSERPADSVARMMARTAVAPLTRSSTQT